MKKTLLLIFALMWMGAAALAHTTDDNTIIYNENEFFDEQKNPRGWDPNGNIPPQPEADYYINMQSAGNVYYRLKPVEGSNPLYYNCPTGILQGNFKIYAKEYWTERGKPGYDGNKYIYGSLREPTGFHRDTYKELGNPGGDMQIEDGGKWYGCMVQFYPSGTSTNKTPGVYITGGSHNTQAIFISAAGVATSSTTGRVDFEITTGGVVKPKEQNYTVTMDYTNTLGPQHVSTQVTGLAGSFEDITDLEPDNITHFTLIAEIKNAPVFDNPSNQEQISGYKNLVSEEEQTYISTPAGPVKFDVFLIGELQDAAWNPSLALQGTLLPSTGTSFTGGSEIYAWVDVPLTGTMRFRFTNRAAQNWDDLNANGVQYYPSAATQKCQNLIINDDEVNESGWYPYNTRETGSTDNAWAPDVVATHGSGSDGLHYNVFFNRTTQKVGVSWSTSVGIDEIPDEMTEKPVDVYDLTGRCVMRGVLVSEIGDRLPQGIYIAGNKKIAIK